MQRRAIDGSVVPVSRRTTVRPKVENLVAVGTATVLGGFLDTFGTKVTVRDMIGAGVRLRALGAT